MLTRRLHRSLLALVMLSAIVNGLLAGGNVDRALIARPAWRHLGMAAWADYTRSADLANGRVFYPAVAFAGTILSLAAAGLWGAKGRSRKGAAGPIYLAAAVMLVCLPVSMKAAPFVLSLTSIDDSNLRALTAAFAGSYFWGVAQTILHSAAFIANVWAIAAITKDGWQTAD